jgi:TolB-like protein
MKVKFTVGLVFVGFFVAAALAQDQSGQVRFIYGVGGYSDSQPFSHPQGIFCDRLSGEVYVCDTGNHQVVIFDRTGFLLLSLFATAFIFGACAGGPRTYLNPEADMSFYQKVGVVPFINLTADRFAGENVTITFVTELLITEKFEVIERGEFDHTVRQVLSSTGGSSSSEMTAAQLKAVGEQAGVNGIIEGVVKEYEMIRVGQGTYPLISLSVKLVDAPTGRVVWESTYSTKGGPKLPIVGWGETHTLSQLAQKACRKVVRQLVRKGF